MRILMVEDNAILGNALRDHVAAQNWDVEWAMSLGAAKTALNQAVFSLVLLDLQLPDGNGLELLRHPYMGSPPIPVIILTAADQIADRLEGLCLGACDYLVKPFNLRELTARMKRALDDDDAKGSAGPWACGSSDSRRETLSRTIVSG